jgi:hypothetical protein
MRVLGYLAALGLGLLGLVFLVAAPQGRTAARVVVALVLLAAAATLITLVRMKAPRHTTTVVQRIEVGGDISVEKLKCRACGGTLDEKALSVKAGAIFATCPYCETSYQLEEAPKW